MIGCLIGLFTPAAGAAGDIEIRHVMYDDPKIELPPPTETISPRLVPLWIEALEGPEVDLKRQAANGIAIVHAAGLADLSETAEPLIRALQEPGQHPVVVEAVADALVVIDARQAADLLFQQARSGGLTVAQTVEPALARWDYRPIRDVWLKRLASPRTRRRLLMLAIEGVAAVGETQAVPDLVKVAQSPDVAPDLRLAAARAIAVLQQEGLEPEARRMLGPRRPTRVIDRLVAASMLSGHQSEAARSLLLELAVDPEPSVAAVALRRLLAVDPHAVVSIIDQVKDRPDAGIRLLGVQALAAEPSAGHVELLAPMLDDPHPDVRRAARHALEKMADQEGLAEPVVAEAMKVAAGDNWRGLEQATILLVRRDHKPAADRLVELLDFPRPEVFLAAAWGLGQLAVPQTLGPMCEKARRETEAALKRPGLDDPVGEQLGHLFQAMGRLKYTPCEPILRHYIPKTSPFHPRLRSAAIWALGHLHAGHPDEELERLLQERLADEETVTEPGEAFEVRLMSAVSLGRMKSQKALGTLRRYVRPQGIGDGLEYACAWAIQQITAEPMPPLEHPVVYCGGWFLNPID